MWCKSNKLFFTISDFFCNVFRKWRIILKQYFLLTVRFYENLWNRTFFGLGFSGSFIETIELWLQRFNHMLWPFWANHGRRHSSGVGSCLCDGFSSQNLSGLEQTLLAHVSCINHSSNSIMPFMCVFVLLIVTKKILFKQAKIISIYNKHLIYLISTFSVPAFKIIIRFSRFGGIFKTHLDVPSLTFLSTLSLLYQVLSNYTITQPSLQKFLIFFLLYILVI